MRNLFATLGFVVGAACVGMIAGIENAVAYERAVTELSFKITPGGPLKLLRLEHASGESAPEIVSIEIVDPRSRRIAQNLAVHDSFRNLSRLPYRAELYEAGTDAAGEVFTDANFDGHTDIRLFFGCGALSNCSYFYWLYDPATGRYRFDESLSGLSGVEFDSVHRAVTARTIVSPSTWEETRFEWQDNLLAETARSEVEVDDAPARRVTDEGECVVVASLRSRRLGEESVRTSRIELARPCSESLEHVDILSEEGGSLH